MTKFLTTRDGKARIAELAAAIETNGGSAPQNCQGFKTSQESRAEIDKLESILADCRARKATAKPGAPTLIQCLSEKLTDKAPSDLAARLKSVDAAMKRLEAITASAKAVAAKSTARASVAALKPSPAAPAMSARDQRRASAKAANTLSASTAGTFSESHLHRAATHRSSPESDKAIAEAELEKRGFTISPEGIISKSSRK
jgi:hypothetical protein